MRRITPLLLLVAAAPLSAQTAARPTPLTRAAASITEADVRRRVGVIAHDSMAGRETPSRGLDLTAQWVAAEFKRFGLKPGGDSATFFQRYPIQRARLDVAASHVGFMHGGKHLHAEFAKDARWNSGAVPAREIGGPALLVGGAMATAGLDASVAKDKVVLVVLDATRMPPAAGDSVFRAFVAAGAKAIVLVSNRDSASFAQRVAAQGAERTRLAGVPASGPSIPAVEVHQRAVASMLTAAGVNLDSVRAATSMIVRPVSGLTVMVDGKETVAQVTAPNTIGILEGTDPVLKNEYLVYSAHMDHVGRVGAGACRARGADSICNGADDDASGTVGVVELAEAFSQAGARPKRSIIFMTVSGEEHGLWGSRYFSEHPTVPVKNIVANLNLDMIGRNWADTIVAIGKEHSDLGATLNRVNAAHPELRMTAIDDIWPTERFYFRSDHYNFARKGVPILFFFNGTHDDYHQATDSPDKIDAEKEARIVQLLFYVGHDIANAAARPKWNPESYKTIVEGPSGRN